MAASPPAQSVERQQAEWKLGSRLATDLEKQVTLLADAFILGYLNHLEQKIVSNSRLSGCFTVKVMVDQDTNAYSLPGGFIYITTGLIEALQNEGQLAAALAHETGHVTARHLTRVDTSIRTWGRLALVGGPIGLALRHYVGPLLTFKLLRDVEFDADRLGLRYVTASAYDPVDFLRMLRLAFPDDDTQSLLDRLYDDHPSTDARIRRLESNSRLSVVPQSEHTRNGGDFVAMKTRFTTLMDNDDRGQTTNQVAPAIQVPNAVGVGTACTF